MSFMLQLHVEKRAEEMEMEVTRQETDSTWAPSPRTGQEQSEAGTTEEEAEDTAFRVKNTFLVVGECEADGLQHVELHASGAHTWAISEFRVNDGLKVEWQPPMEDPAFFQMTHRCISQHPM